MGKLSRLSLVLGLVSAAACGDDGGKTTIDAPIVVVDSAVDAAPDATPDAPPDAPPRPADLSCVSTPPPTTAADPVTLAGTANTISTGGQATLVNALVVAKKGAQTLSSMRTDANGAFTLMADTGGTPVDGYVYATCTPGNGGSEPDCTANGAAKTLRPTAVYPAAPISMNTPNVPVLMTDQQTFGLLTSIGGANEAAGQGSMIIALVDCANQPVENATITVQQNGADVGNIRYARPFMMFPAPNQSATSTDSSGIVYVIGVPGDAAGKATTIQATVNGTAFRARVIGSFPATLTTAIHAP